MFNNKKGSFCFILAAFLVTFGIFQHANKVKKKNNSLQNKEFKPARKRTRTSTGLPPLVPEVSMPPYVVHILLYRATYEEVMWYVFHIKLLGLYNKGVDTGVNCRLFLYNIKMLIIMFENFHCHESDRLGLYYQFYLIVL